MSDLEQYLSTHYLNAGQCAQACGLSVDAFDVLVQAQLAPAPAYVVTPGGMLVSHVFGAMPAPGATPGRYFHPSQRTWIAAARHALAQNGPQGAQTALREQFIVRLQTALAALDRSSWRLRDSFNDDGTPIAAGLAQRGSQAWECFLHGTFGLCVADPASEAAIARKEVLQEQLTALSENGSIAAFTPALAARLGTLIDDYAAAAMPFSPVEFHRSSRKRLVDDLRARLNGAAPAPRTGR